MILYCTAFYVIYFLHCVNCQTLSEIKQLYSDVFANLQTEVIPATNQSVPLDVSVRFYLLTISRFEETQETIVILGAIQMTWMDGGISWHPASYGNKEMIPMSKKRIWTPSLTLINAVDVLEPIGQDADFNANIFHNGTVIYITGGVMLAKCKTDISKFPYDSQTCTLQFTPWNVFSSDINLTNEAVSPVDLNFMTANSDWTLESYSARAYVWNGYPMFDVTLTIKRQSLYYSIMVVCPTLLFSLINPLVFLLPVESGERIGFAMTILLSYAIFLTLVSAAIPASSNPMCIMLIIMVMTIMISGIIVVITIGISALYYRDETREMSQFWKFVGARMPWSRKRNRITPLVKEKKSDQPDSYSDLVTSWKEVTDSIDTLCMIIFYVIIIIGTSVFFIIVI